MRLPRSGFVQTGLEEINIDVLEADFGTVTLGRLRIVAYPRLLLTSRPHNGLSANGDN